MKRIMFLKIAVLAVSIALIVLGIAQKGYIDVMNKAVRICFECIGIG